MDAIVGLGAAGCRLADTFSAYPQYKTYKIDVGLSGEGSYGLPECLTHREYEESAPDMTGFLSEIEGEQVLFVVGGSGYVSGAILKILEQTTTLGKKASVLYVKPDTQLLSGDRLLQERLTCMVLQEYARSGVLEKIYLVHNPSIEKLVGDVPVKQYHQKMNEVITSTFHMLMVFAHTESEYESTFPAPPSARIITFGVLNVEKNEESFFFPLDNVTDKCYYYAMNQSSLEEDGKLFTKIKEQVRGRSTEGNRVSYLVYSTKYEENLGYCVAQSNQVQFFPEKNEKELDKP